MKIKVAGITLIEVIVATTLLVSALGAAITMVGSSTIMIAGNRDRLAATYLVQECLELSRNVRDSASVQTLWHCPFFDIDDHSGPDWTAKRSIAASTIGNEQTAIDCFRGGVFDQFGVAVADADNELSKISLNGTDFTRTLTIKDPVSVDKPTLSGNGTYKQMQQMTIQCDVDWSFRGSEKSVTASQILTRWKR